MLVKIGNRVINMGNVVEVEVRSARPERLDEETGEALRAVPTRVTITTTAVDSHYDDGGDHPEHAHLGVRPHTINLNGEEAERFLQVLPVHEPDGEKRGRAA